jgi:hypothetical protein
MQQHPWFNLIRARPAQTQAAAAGAELEKVLIDCREQFISQVKLVPATHANKDMLDHLDTD